MDQDDHVSIFGDGIILFSVLLRRNGTDLFSIWLEDGGFKNWDEMLSSQDPPIILFVLILFLSSFFQFKSSRLWPHPCLCSVPPQTWPHAAPMLCTRRSSSRPWFACGYALLPVPMAPRRACTLHSPLDLTALQVPTSSLSRSRPRGCALQIRVIPPRMTMYVYFSGTEIIGI